MKNLFKPMFSAAAAVLTLEEPQKVITSKDIQNDMLSELNFILNKDFTPAEKAIEKVSEANSHILSKAETLRSLGFRNTPTAINAEVVEEKIREKNSDLILEKQEIEITNKYRIEYPGYKFVPERIFNQVCEKYDLFTSEPERFIKEIPDKNLNEISDFIGKHGIFWQVLEFTRSYGEGVRERLVREFLKEKEASDFHQDYRGCSYGPTTLKRNAKIEITAPISHFDLTNAEVKDRRISTIKVEDPIVSRPVEGGRIIISVWDKEAEIPEVNNMEFLN